MAGGVTDERFDIDAVYDPWTPVDYKQGLSRRHGKPGMVAPDWVGEHKRRLWAYGVYRAYLQNAARRHLYDDGSKEFGQRRDAYREYGDPATLRDTIRSALIGEAQEIVVEGAQHYDAEYQEPEVPEGGELEPDAQALVDRQRRARAAFAMQEFLRAWAKTERLTRKTIETENNAVGLGDGVYSLGNSLTKGRTRLQCWDPAFYFPVLTSKTRGDDFPMRVHIAWEELPESESDKRLRIHRITWELAPIAPPMDEDGTVLPLPEGDRYDLDVNSPTFGRILREYPWNDGKPSHLTCYLTEAVWIVERETKKPSIDDLRYDRAVFEVDEAGPIDRRDLRQDFIPVVHVPNTIAELDHYGTSGIALVMQLLDDIANTDTDLQGASALAGSPIIAAFGVDTEGDTAPRWHPGMLLEGPAEGRLDITDTSSALDALLKLDEWLLKRLQVNAHTPGELLGRIERGEVNSGIELRLRFGPLERMVREGRLVRDEKYTLLLKFVWRMSLAGQFDGTPPAYVEPTMMWGSFLPSDLAAVVEVVSKAMTAKIVSRETAVRMLVEAGMPIEDATEEVAKIEARDFEGAAQLATATGDAELTYEYLGKEAPEGGFPPVGPEPTSQGGE